MAENNREQMADNASEISSFSDSSDEAKKEVEIVEEAIEETDKPVYTEEDLETLIEFIRNMIFLFDYDEDDFNEEVVEVIKLWLKDANCPLLFVFYDGDILTASLGFPLCPFNDLMYFMREPDQLFNVVRFHDDIMFGTLQSDIEGSLLVILEQVYGPLILATELSENVKANVLGGYNNFMTYLTELHYKLSGFTLLYVPREGSDMDVQEVVLNRSMIKRLESVVIDWTSQIRSTLSDTQHFVPDNLICPADEYSFWIYRHEVLSAIKTQFETPNIEHILQILNLAQSLYTKPLREVLHDLTREIEVAESNIPFLKLLVDPCFAIRTLNDEDDLCSQLIYVMHIIRFIGVDSSHLRRDECITKLFLYLSNEIVSCCVQSIDINKILMGSPCYGIEICNLKINCCESYKIIYEEMLDHFKQDYAWNLDYATIFNQINAFIQRLCDILEICEAMLIFVRYSGSNSYKNFRFPCNNAQEYEQKCDQVMTIFTKGIESIQSSVSAILDINNKDWYETVAQFRGMLRNLDDVIENLLSNVFLVAENLEEKIDVLVALLNFFSRDSIKESFMRKIAEIWKIFHTELTIISKEVSAGINIHPTLLPTKSGQYTMLKIKFERLCRLKNLLERCRFFPTYNESEETLYLFETCEKQVKLSLKKFNDSWTKSLSPDFGAWFHRNLICRSQIRPGLLECHIERGMLDIFNEAHFFKVLGAATPSILDLEKNDSTRQTFDSVIRVVLYFNSVVSSISEKERLFFKPMIQQTERKLEPLRSKLTWDEDLNEYIDTFVMNVKELLDIIQIYKRENFKISRSMEIIYNLELFKLNKSQNQQLNDLFKNISDQKKQSLSQLVGVYADISKNIFCIYDHLGSNLRRMGESWIQYVRKIDRLLKAAVYNSSLITLKNIQKALTESHQPILSIEIVLDRTGVVYQPSLTHVEIMLKRLTTEVTTTIKIIPTLCQKFQIDAGENIYDAFLNDEQYLSEERKIKAAINNTIKILVAFKEKWNVFRPFWSVNRSSFIEQFKLANMTSEAFQKNIEKFDELLNQLTTQSELTICECIHVDAQKLKYAITNHIHDWQLKYIEYLKCVSYGMIIDFNNTLNQNMQSMSVIPKEVEELKELEATFNNCYDDIPRMVMTIDNIVGYFNVLEKHISDILPEALHLRKNMHDIWKQYMEYVNKIKEEIADYQTQFKLSMTNEAACLKVNALEMLKMLDIEMPINDDILPEDAFLMIETLMEKLELLKAQEQIIAAKMHLLGVEYHPLDIVIEITRKLESMKLIWKYADAWQKTRQAMLSQAYEMVLVDYIHEEILRIRCNLESLVNCLLPDMHYPIYIKVTTEVVDFCKTMDIMIDMKRSYLRDRHWITIQHITKTPYEIRSNLLIQNMIEYEFYEHEKEFKILCNAARKEFEIETQITFVERSVSQFKLIAKQHTLTAPGIINSDDIILSAKHNLITIKNLIVSEHRDPFQEKIYFWEETLNYIIEVLEVVSVIAQNAEIQSEIFNVTKFSSCMTEFNSAFIACNEQWNDMVRYIVTSNLRNDICPQGIDLLQKLDVIQNQFEQVFLIMSQTMSDKRKFCSRLNLVPDDLLLKMIAYPTNLEFFQKALDYMFENIANTCINSQELSDKFGNLEVTGIRTNIDETITFVQPIIVESVATSENIIRMMEAAIQQALKRDLQKCLHQLKETFFKRIESGWIDNFSYQICLKSNQIDNTHLIKNAIMQCELLKNNKPMKMLRTLQNRLLNNLAKSYKNNAEKTEAPSLRNKINAMIVAEINTRDVIDKLIASAVKNGLNNFEWLSCIRSYWSNESLDCVIAHVNNRYHYGFECKSSIEPLFITPFTHRLLMVISSALKYGFTPYLTGNEEASINILKQLSTELGVLFVILSCDRHWKPECILRCFEGMLKLQSWLCFSGFENIPSHILTRINEKLKESSFNERKNYVLDLKKNKILTTFQFFVTTTKKPNKIELDRAIVRNVCTTVPDQEIIFQNILWIIGFPKPRKMAHQLNAFMLNIAMYLPALSYLWTPTRIQHAILKMKATTEHEAAIVLQDEFYPSLAENEKQIFNKCLRTIFKISFKQEYYVSRVDDVIKFLFDGAEMVHSKQLETNVRSMIQSLASCSPFMIVLGDPCSGKSRMLDIALQAMSADGRFIKKYVVNPETLQDDKKNNAIDIILKTILASTVHTRKCIIFDSVARSQWIEKLGSMERHLNNDLEKMYSKNVDVKFVVETSDLSTITPKSLANFSIIYVDSGNLTWQHIFLSWIERIKFLPMEFKTDLRELADNYFEVLLQFRTSATFIQNTAINKAKTFCSLHNTIMTSWRKDESSFTALHWKIAFKMLFFFCCVWSFGAHLDTTERGKFDVLLRESISDVMVSFPLKGNVYQYFINVSENSCCWQLWNESHLGTNRHGTFIHSIDTIPYQFITQCMISNESPVLITSNEVVGKSELLKNILLGMKVNGQTTCVTSLNSNTSSKRLREILRWNTIKISKEIIYPKERKNMIWFIDDLHSVLCNKTDTTEFLRHLIEHRAWIDKKHPQCLQQTQFLAAMRNIYPLNTFPSSTIRLLNKFHTISYNACSDESNAYIFSNKIIKAIQSTTPNKLFEVLAPATIHFIRSLAIKLPATPTKPRYQFSLKTINRILNSLCILNPNICHYEKNPLLRLWIHECFRETWDLLDCVDYKLYYEIFNDIISKYFEATLHSICPGNKSPLFCDVLNQEDCYEDVKEINQLKQFVEKAANFIPASKTIVYEEAVEHASKLLRMIRIKKGHLVLVGETGSGRQTICDLAARILNYKMASKSSKTVTEHIENICLPLNFAIDETENVVDKQIGHLFELASKTRVICLVLVDDINYLNHYFLEFLNNFIVNASMSGFLSPNIYNEPNVIEAIQSNLKFVLCLPMNSKLYRNLLNTYTPLLTSITTNCIHPLTETSLMEVAKLFFKSQIIFDVPILSQANIKDYTEPVHRKRDSLIKSTEERFYNSAVDAVARFHTFLQHHEKLKHDTLTSWFFELLFTFERVLMHKRNTLRALYAKFNKGINKIMEATQNVTILQDLLEKQQFQIETYQCELQTFIENIETQTIEADEQRQEVAIQRVKIGAEEVVCKQLADIAGADLAKAMPALNSAIAALDSLNKKDMNEIKSYARPPVKVELVLNAVMILLGKEPTWVESKRQLGEQKFLDTLRNFDKNNITEKTLKTIQSYVRNPELEPNKVGIVSKAAKSLILWVRAIENYGKVYKYVGPKIKKMEDANASLLEKQLLLKASEQKLEELAQKLAELQKEYDHKMKCKQELEEKARQMAIKLQRAKSLVAGLSNEKIRWTKIKEQLENEYHNLIGDTLHAAGTLVYFGSLSSVLRDNIRMQWMIDLEALEIPFNKLFNLFEFFFGPNDFQNWQNNGMSMDSLSCENATILLQAKFRTPLVIDPQGEIEQWIVGIHSINDLFIHDTNDEISLHKASIMLKQSKTIVFNNFQEKSMPIFIKSLHNLLGIEHDTNDIINHKPCLAKALDRYSIYLLSNEYMAYTSLLKKDTNMINFVTGLPGLETKLLTIVVQHENPNLEERKEILMQTIIDNNKTLFDLEENILRLLNESQMPLLENEELYSTLQISKHTTERVNIALDQDERTRQEIDSSREKYRPCAERSCLLFFVVDSMKNINSLYTFSLHWYFSLFKISLQKCPRSQAIEERNKKIIDYHTYNVYRNVCFGLKPMDRNIFGFLLCIRLLFAKERMSLNEYNFLLHGPRKIDRGEQVENPSPNWISSEQWDSITELDKLPGFLGIAQSFEESNDDWNNWYKSSCPEVEKMPVYWERNLTKFQKNIVVRCLRLDRFEPCMTEYIDINLGKKYAYTNRCNLSDMLSESSAHTPILLLTDVYSNPWSEVQFLAKSEVKYFNMNCELLQDLVHCLKNCVSEEKWLFITYPLKSQSFVLKFPTVLKYLKSVDPKSNFRLWVNVLENERIPLIFLQNCTKFFYHKPMGIQQNLSMLFEEIGEREFEKLSKNVYQTQNKKLLFSLCFLHSLLNGRSKFETLGWLHHYSFELSDFYLARKLLTHSIKDLTINNAKQSNQITESISEILPQQFIEKVCLEICYKSQITNFWDQRIYDSYFNEIFHKQFINTSRSTLTSFDNRFSIPRDGNFQAYKIFIQKQIPVADGINVYALNENANIQHLKSQSSYILQMLHRVPLDPQENSLLQNKPCVETNFENVKQTIQELLTKLPVCLDYDNAVRIVGANKTPVSDALLLEIHSYNQIVRLVRRNLQQTFAILLGEHCLNEEYEDFLENLRQNRVPHSWLRYPTNKCFSDWIHDLRCRVEFFRKWTETGQLSTNIILGFFIRPVMFLNSVLQLFARANNVPVTNVDWRVSVFTTMKPIVKFSIEEGFIAREMYLQNAGWDLEKQCLKEPNILQMSSLMPPIYFKPVIKEADVTERDFICPCFYDFHRSEETFICSIILKTGDFQKEKWVNYNTAITLTN